MPTRKRNRVTYREACRSRGSAASNCAWSERCQTEVRYRDYKSDRATLSGSTSWSIFERLGPFRRASTAMVECPRLRTWEFGSADGVEICFYIPLAADRNAWTLSASYIFETGIQAGFGSPRDDVVTVVTVAAPRLLLGRAARLSSPNSDAAPCPSRRRTGPTSGSCVRPIAPGGAIKASIN